MNRVGTTKNYVTMKKFTKIPSLKTSKMEDFKMKKSNMYAIKGGCTCGTRSMCHVDGTDEGDAAMNDVP